jgi:hypothetical protein
MRKRWSEIAYQSTTEWKETMSAPLDGSAYRADRVPSLSNMPVMPLAPAVVAEGHPRRDARPHVSEIAPDLYRISVLYPEINLQFNHFLVKDEEPLLFHTGLRRMFTEVREGVSTVLDPARLRWISWSHFESDECGSLPEWMTIAPHAQPACGMVGALVSANAVLAGHERVLRCKHAALTLKEIASATTTRLL